MRHAYLIVAHNEFGILEKLVKLLDSEYNDIFLHIDKKIKNFNFKEFKSKINKSKLIYIPRNKISWGGDSQIKCELTLLKKAIQGKYDYYHLMSGVDLPIKTKEEINNYFETNNGKIFLDLDDEAVKAESYLYRIEKYYLFQNLIGRANKIKEKIFNKLQIAFIRIQSIIGTNRLKNTQIKFMKGTNWFSITHEAALYALSKIKFIKTLFYKSICADELFLQTVFENSPLKDRIVYNSLRFIDWKRGNPYTFLIEDFQTLINSDCLWARKFNETIDADITMRIYQYLVEKGVNYTP